MTLVTKLKKLWLRISMAWTQLVAPEIQATDIIEDISDNMTAWIKDSTNAKIFDFPPELVAKLKLIDGPKTAQFVVQDVNQFMFQIIQKYIYKLNQEVRDHNPSTIFLDEKEYNYYLGSIEEITAQMTSTVATVIQQRVNNITSENTKAKEPEPKPKEESKPDEFKSGFNWGQFSD